MGGVSVHVRRLARLRAAQGHRVRVYNESPDPAPPDPLLLPAMGWPRFCFHLLVRGADILHVHTANLRFRGLIWLWRLRGCVVVVTLHTADPREQFGKPGTPGRWWIRLNLGIADALVLVGEGARVGLREELAGYRHVHTITSWITPSPEELVSPLPGRVEQFLGAGGAVLVANGAIRLRPDGELYGFDQMLDMLSILVGRGHDIRLLCYVSSISSQNGDERAHYLELLRRSSGPGLEGRVLWHESLADEFAPVIQRAAVVLRPTRWESFGQTVVQGLMAGRPVVASDAAPRQGGAILYRTGDAVDFANKVEQALAEGATGGAAPPEDGARPLMELYRACIRARRGKRQD